MQSEENAVRILGIDPGYAIVGWGIVDFENSRFCTVDYGAIRTKAHTDTVDRLEKIYEGVNLLIEKYKPTHLAIEELFFNTNQTTGIVVAEARGIILLAAKQHGLTIGEYTPLQVKQAVVGYGRAEKNQVIQMVTTMLGLKEAPKPDDTADALAIAICHGHSAHSRMAGYFNN